jgi:enoyl-CoA hydratase
MPEIDVGRYEWLKISKHQTIATVVLSNPTRRNALGPAMHHEVERVWLELDADDDVRVVILTGDGNSFCAGADLSDQSAGGLSKRRRPETLAARRLFWNMLDFEKPILAKVRGPAYGVGANIALAADVVFASEDARFCDSHVKVGIAPGDGGAALWPLLIGFHRAKEFLMTGDPIPAAQAAEMGLINHCVRAEELDATVQALAERLAAGAPLAISYAKMAVNVMLKQLMAGAFETSLAYDFLTLTTDDHQEGARAFKEKRQPNFRGS